MADVLERPRTHWPIVGALVLPIVIVNAIGFAVPILNLLWISFYDTLPTGGLGRPGTGASWRELVSDTYNLELIWRSIWVSGLVTACALVCSYPIAWYIHRSNGLKKVVLLLLVVTPLLTSAVVRTYGWVGVLGDSGLVPTASRWLFGAAPQLINNVYGVIIGMTEIQMPYMILALLVGFGRVDPFFEEASQTLGASPSRTFWEIVFPLSLQGAALGCLFVFIYALSSFVTPAVLGGGKVNLLAIEIYTQSTLLLNWPMAAVISMVTLVLFSTALLLYSRLVAKLDY